LRIREGDSRRVVFLFPVNVAWKQALAKIFFAKVKISGNLMKCIVHDALCDGCLDGMT
jgi:hypothetical protein